MPTKTEKTVTSQQKKFAREYIVDFNGTKAAIRAGYAEGSAAQNACRMLTYDKVNLEIAKEMKKQAVRTGIDADWLLERLVAEAEADLADILEDNGGLKKVSEWPKIWRTGLVGGVDIQELVVDGNVTGSLAKVKLSERVRRLELIGKHVNVQAFLDKVKTDTTTTITFDDDIPGDIQELVNVARGKK